MYKMHQYKKYQELNPADIIQKLPGIVTSINIQARNSKRASVFVDNAFLFGITLELLTTFSITKGGTLDKKTALEILDLESKYKLREYLLRLLSLRDHSKVELKQKVIQKGISPKFLDEILEEFEALNYLNEERFVKAFIRDKTTLSGWGSIKIKLALKKKGISDTLIHTYLDDQNTDALKEQMQTLVLKKAARFKRESDEIKRKKKIYEYLARKGYPSDVIIRYIDEYAKMI